MKKLFIFILVALVIFNNIRSEIIFKSIDGSDFIIKVSELDWNIKHLYSSNGMVKYKFPIYWYSGNVAFFYKGNSELFNKEDINFCKIVLFIDNKGNVIFHEKHNGICLKPF
ncbi:hypothetical protein [Volucribacter amazonae]|uniref:Uncharacterized protein n=1 Tax=Volucribacter amazonae TaxID=256731 RepID=A0A9X4PEZ2_9PAST|nr:hypothetical protein [Volucribacter amazonae]MDG6896181.1 hypothetical protein [Volucribacter amazonae]